jgi:hypothetical protein
MCHTYYVFKRCKTIQLSYQDKYKCSKLTFSDLQQNREEVWKPICLTNRSEVKKTGENVKTT